MRLFFAAAIAAAVSITGPSSLDVKEGDLFIVEGVTVEEFANCDIYIRPEKSKPVVVRLRDDGDNPVLFIKGLAAWDGDIILDVNVPGAYEVIFHRLVIGDDSPPDDDNGDTSLAEYVRKITKNKSEEVSDIFFALATRIASGNLSGSKAIVEATRAKMAKIKEWAKWYNQLMPHLLDDLDLDTQNQWEDAYLVIANEVKQ